MFSRANVHTHWVWESFSKAQAFYKGKTANGSRTAGIRIKIMHDFINLTDLAAEPVSTRALRNSSPSPTRLPVKTPRPTPEKHRPNNRRFV
jgi:hypothetical protein